MPDDKLELKATPMGTEQLKATSAIKLIRQQWPLRHVYSHYRQSLRWNISVLKRLRKD